MAKLNGVKTVDMVNGEITKIAYEGVEYVLLGTDVTAEPGDLLQSNVSLMDVSEGDFFKTFENDGDIEFKDNDDDIRDANYGEGRYNIFRKISESKPTLEQRVESLESDVAALKSSESSLKGEKKSANTFKIGDTIKVVRNTASWGKKEKAGYHVGGQGVVKVGAIGKVTSVSGDFVTAKFAYGDVYGDSQRKKELRFDEIELASETIEFEGATYRKVEREAREGDVVIFTDDTTDRYFITKNKPYKALSNGRFVDNDGDRMKIYANDSKQNRTCETVDVYEATEPAKYVPQEGDIVVLVKNSTYSENNVGDIGKVVEKGELVERVQVQVPNGSSRNLWSLNTDIRKATPAEVEKYEQAIHKASFAVGDYVKIVKSYVGCEGEIVKITEIGEYRTPHGICDFVIEHSPKLDGRFAVKAEQIVKATDAEIAKATAPKLKAGDFVKFKRSIADTQAGKPYLIEVKPSSGYLAFKDDAGDWCSIERTGEYEILSAEEAKWAKIGRRIGELRKGDIVRIIDRCGARLTNGDLIEVISDSVEMSAHVKGDWAVFSKLVTPVESRFNA